MKMTQVTKDILAYRRFAQTKEAEGWHEIKENGHPLWKLRRGAWSGRRIAECAIGPDGQSIFIKLADE